MMTFLKVLITMDENRMRAENAQFALLVFFAVISIITAIGYFIGRVIGGDAPTGSSLFLGILLMGLGNGLSSIAGMVCLALKAPKFK